MAAPTYETFLSRVKELSTSRSIEALLDWDQETYMPPQAADDRANQLAFMAGLSHERLTSDELGRLLESCAGELRGEEAAETNVREIRRERERAVRLPTALVQEIARVSSLAKNEWAAARKESNFARFAPHLAKLLELKREVADRIGWTSEPYDALMDEYEPGALSADVQAVFDRLKGELVSLVHAITRAPRQPKTELLARPCAVEAQQRFCRQMAEALCFEFEAGRIDISTHPFCTSMSPRDVRMTTRYDERYMPMSLFGVLHETGHALYEQGLDAHHTGTPRARAISLGIHESQSRLWENMIGRSRPFWSHYFPSLQQAFPSLAGVSLEDWVFAINQVKPSLIRVEADEVTYGLHIMLRFDLERRMIQGKLTVKDVPAAWNDGMKSLLGVTPPNDAEGCLQDIHWSMGAFGYFPTYQLGNLYAAQILERAREEFPQLETQVGRGELRPLREWLRRKIHQHGQRYRAGELMEVVTGRPLTHEPYLRYLNGKFKPLYGLT